MERLILKDRNEIKLELVVSVSFLAHSTAFQWGCSPGGTVRGDPSQHQHSLLNRIALPYYFFISFHYWHEVICVFSCSLSSHKSVIFVGMRTVGFIPYVPSAWNIGGTIKVECLLNKRMKNSLSYLIIQFFEPRSIETWIWASKTTPDLDTLSPLNRV